MKNTLLAALCIVIAILACNKEKNVETLKPQASAASPHSGRRFSGDVTDTVGGSVFISVDVANQMINSYLYSINSTANDTDIRSFTVNADSLRALLGNSSIKTVKLIFAHTMSYINAGNSGVNAGYQSGALTIIIAGIDTVGNYVYHDGNALDHLVPCPYTCPSGQAANDLLQ